MTTGGRISSIHLFRLNTQLVNRNQFALHLMENTDGERPPEASAGHVAGSFMLGWLMRPLKHDGQPKGCTPWLDNEKRNFL